jgi:hypothetical protein
MITTGRPRYIDGLAALDLLGAGLSVVASITIGLFALTGDEGPVPWLIAASGGAAVMAFLAATAGIGLLGLHPYGRRAQVALALIVLPAFPFGTVFSLLLLTHFGKPEVKALFSDAPPAMHQTPTPAARRDSGAVVAATIVGGVTLFVTASVLAGIVAIPEGLHRRARTAAETAALADLRAVIAAEAAYAKANGGHFDRLECLAEPSRCLDHQPTIAGFLPPSFTETRTRKGYVFTFNPGPPPGEDDSPGQSPSSMLSYSFVARPEAAGGRWFCGDGTGRLCASKPVEAPGTSAFCPADWDDVP